ncbi:hypothetical protein MTYM_00925 [Methylococcales bacterium]|nr:hypothetical protein MTYM_00925 [Methylococcales bacterium]
MWFLPRYRLARLKTCSSRRWERLLVSQATIQDAPCFQVGQEKCFRRGSLRLKRENISPSIHAISSRVKPTDAFNRITGNFLGAINASALPLEFRIGCDQFYQGLVRQLAPSGIRPILLMDYAPFVPSGQAKIRPVVATERDG